MEQNKNEQNKWYIEVLQKNSLSLALLLISAFVTLLNTYSFIKLTPIVQSVSALNVTVAATEKKVDDHLSTNKTFIEDVATLKQAVNDIKERTQRIESKIDRLN